MFRRSAVLILTVGLAAASCGGDDAGPTTTGPATTTTTTTQDGLPVAVDVAGASGLPGGTRVVVSGLLIFEQGRARLCSAFLESYPVQCGGATLDVDGLVPADIVGLTIPEPPIDVQWADFPVVLTGVIRDGTLAADVPDHLSTTAGHLTLRFAYTPQPVPAGGTTVWWAFDVTNTGTAVTTLTFGTGQRADVALADELGELYRWSIGMSFTQAIADIVIEPGQTISFVIAGEIDLPAGEYSGTARVTASGLEPFPIQVTVK